MNSANNTFALKLFAESLKSGDDNVFISPASVAIALAMTHNGAHGKTAQAFANTLALPESATLAEINKANKELLQALKSEDVQLEIANALWGRRGMEFKPEFLSANQANYQAEVTALDFVGDEAGSLKRINGWCFDKTKGKIEKILSQINPASVLFLMNAVYFKGNWSKPFNEDSTRKQAFTLGDGSTKEHPLMFQSGRYDYHKGDGFQVVSLPYGDKKRFSMKVFLPDEGTSLSDFQSKMTASNWQSWMDAMKDTKGSVQLPKFKMEYEQELSDALKGLGLEDAFEETADFRNLAEYRVDGLAVSGFRISEVKHKTYVDVNEKGTEAAAVTSIGMVFTTSISMEPNFWMQVNRPFVFAIVDDETNTILFLGSIKNPEVGA